MEKARSLEDAEDLIAEVIPLARAVEISYGVLRMCACGSWTFVFDVGKHIKNKVNRTGKFIT